MPFDPKQIEQNRKDLYNSLVGRGVNTGDYESFYKGLDDNDNKANLYNSLVRNGINTGNHEDFFAGLGYSFFTNNSAQGDTYTTDTSEGLTGNAPAGNVNNAAPAAQGKGILAELYKPIAEVGKKREAMFDNRETNPVAFYETYKNILTPSEKDTFFGHYLETEKVDGNRDTDYDALYEILKKDKHAQSKHPKEFIDKIRPVDKDVYSVVRENFIKIKAAADAERKKAQEKEQRDTQNLFSTGSFSALNIGGVKKEHTDPSKVVNAALEASYPAIEEYVLSKHPELIVLSNDLQYKRQQLLKKYKAAKTIAEKLNIGNEITQLENWGKKDIDKRFGKSIDTEINKIYNSVIEREYVNSGLPKNAGEYIARGLRHSLIGQLINGIGTTVTERQIQDMQDAAYDPSFLTKAGSGALNLIADAPAFGAGGKIGSWGVNKAVKVMTNSAIKELEKRGYTVATDFMLKRALRSTGGKILKHTLPSATSFGVYDAAHNITSQLSSGEDFSLGELALATGKGLATGGLLGGYNLAASKIGLHAAKGWKIPIGFGKFTGENMVFLGTGALFEGRMPNIDDILHSVALLGILKGKGYAVRKLTGAGKPLQDESRFKGAKEQGATLDEILNDTRLTVEELQELNDAGYFIKGNDIIDNIDRFYANREQIIKDEAISQSTKIKLINASVGNKPLRDALSEIGDLPLFGNVGIVAEENGKHTVYTFAWDGNVFNKKTFKSEQEAEKDYSRKEQAAGDATILFLERTVGGKNVKSAFAKLMEETGKSENDLQEIFKKDINSRTDSDKEIFKKYRELLRDTTIRQDWTGETSQRLLLMDADIEAENALISEYDRLYDNKRYKNGDKIRLVSYEGHDFYLVDETNDIAIIADGYGETLTVHKDLLRDIEEVDYNEDRASFVQAKMEERAKAEKAAAQEAETETQATQAAVPITARSIAEKIAANAELTQEELQYRESNEAQIQQEVKAIEVEKITESAPKQKDGKVDYDLLLDQNPEAFAILNESEDGAEVTREELTTVSTNIGKKIAAEQNKYDKAASINERKKIRQKISEFSEKKKRIDAVIAARYAEAKREAAAPAQEATQAAATAQETVDIQPVGKGQFGNIYDQFKGKAKEAIAFLMEKKEGEAIGVFHRDDVGDIDLPYGKTGEGGFGLAHIIERREATGQNVEELLETLEDVINNGKIIRDTDRIYLQKDDKKAVVRLDYDGKAKNWVVTAYFLENNLPLEKGGVSTPPSDSRTSDVTDNTTPKRQDKGNEKSLEVNNTSEEKSIYNAKKDEKVKFIGEPQSREEAIALAILRGKKIRWSDKKVNGTVVSHGFGKELGLSRSNKERMGYFNIIDNKGLTPEEWAQSIYEEDDSGLFSGMDDMEIKDVILEVVSRVHSTGEAFRYIMDVRERRAADEERYVEGLMQQAEIEEYGMPEEDYYAALDAEIEQIYGNVTEEEWQKVNEMTAEAYYEDMQRVNEELNLPASSFESVETDNQNKNTNFVENNNNGRKNTENKGLSENGNQAREAGIDEAGDTNNAGNRATGQVGSMVSDERSDKGREGDIHSTSETLGSEQPVVSENGRTLAGTSGNRAENIAGKSQSERKLTDSQQQELNKSVAEYDAHIEQAKRGLINAQAEYDAAKKDIGGRFSDEKQGALFGSEEVSDKGNAEGLFGDEVKNDFGEDNLMRVFNEQKRKVAAAQGRLKQLQDGRDKFIADRRDAILRQRELYDTNAADTSAAEKPSNVASTVNAEGKRKIEIQIPFGKSIEIEVDMGDLEKRARDEYNGLPTRTVDQIFESQKKEQKFQRDIAAVEQKIRTLKETLESLNAGTVTVGELYEQTGL
jgi:hypothetical protein